MHKVVSNTTPIIALLKINKLSVLKELYGIIHVPYAVYNEMEEGKNKIYYRDLSSEPWIIIEKINDDQIKEILIDLDKGEAEAIILAKK